MKIYLVRHGQTDQNKQGRVQGKNGLPLNLEGIKQAEQTKAQLKNIVFENVYSSPSIRAVQTAKIISGIEPILDNRLDVYDLGEADGLKKEEVKTIMNGLIPDPEIYAGVENPEHYAKRIESFVDEILQKYSANEDINILVCGHKCTTGYIFAYLQGMPDDGNFLTMSLPNGAYKVIDLKNK